MSAARGGRLWGEGKGWCPRRDTGCAVGLGPSELPRDADDPGLHTCASVPHLYGGVEQAGVRRAELVCAEPMCAEHSDTGPRQAAEPVCAERSGHWPRRRGLRGARPGGAGLLAE